MKYASLFVLAMTLLFVGEAQAKDLKEIIVEIKQPVTLKSSKNEKMNVVFNHKSHAGINCFTCHHMASSKGRYVPCSTCHPNKGRSNEQDSLFVAFHSKNSKHSCYSCHKNKVAQNPDKYGLIFTNCRPCHMPSTTSK
ncbi:MAG: cytochrome c3 family protein [Desulfovibrio sp.]|nr:cytochrome c3 family protein [Desulfovibrio sp.]MBR4741603.1 cytochrome c3 family protein [Desulfovibrio sp.]